GGAQGVADRWAAELGDAIVLGAPVRRVVWRDGEVVVHGERGAIAARRVVIAVPPPLAARIELDPAGPARRDQLVQRAAMGAIVKVIVAYERPFWRERELSGEVVSLGGPASVVFDNCSHDLRQPALLAFVQAEAARRWTAAPDDAGPVLDQLARYFGDEARRPVTIATADWAAEPWSRGCPVAVMAPRALTSTGTTLREPVGPIHFAGTETAVEWTGYIEGALESGERAAREVIRAL
ncbi:MAG: FAD-dependent oxidoreductase, partial [Myxococcales bacterium]|nr:FAD-dependent oxidoreductase [Myxococcales bacterium]